MCMAPKIPPPVPPPAPPPPPTKTAQKALNPTVRRKSQSSRKGSPLTIRRSSVSMPSGGSGVNYSN